MSFVLFWKKDGEGGFLSQWFDSKFTLNGITYNNAEQYMMHQKAVLFGDTEIAAKILASKSPRTIKSLGRKVKGFTEAVWIKNRSRIIYEGNLAKFSQNRMLKELLLDTRDDILVEASPYDKIYGIGMTAKNKNAKKPEKWLGKNLLGKALMAVRTAIKEK